MKLLTALGSSVLATAFVVSAQGPGITIVQQETRDGKTTTTQMQMDKMHMRAEAGGTTVMVFDGEAQVMRVIQMDRKTYTEMSKAQMEEMSQKMAQAMEQLKNLPPEQRAMMEKMMARGGRAMAGMSAPAPISYRASGADTVGKWSCTKYVGMRGQEKVAELCTVDPTALGLAVSDFDVMKHFAEFMKSLVPQMAEQISVIGSEANQGYSGFPVRRTTFASGQTQSVSELKEIARGAIPATAWQAPAGFKREGPPR